MEVEKPSPAVDLDEETFSQIASLQHNPGFTALVAKLNLRKYALKTELETKKCDNVDEYRSLQHGIYWCNWLQREIAAEVSKRDRREKPRSAFEAEEQEFQRVSQALEVIGRDH